MIDQDTCSLEDVVEDIYPEVISFEEAAAYPDDTIYKSIADVIRVAFFVDVAYTDGTSVRWPLSQRDITRWNVEQTTIEEICATAKCTVPIDKWNRIGWWGNTYEYPVFDRNWTPVLLNQSEVETPCLNGAPLLMIPEPDRAIVTGARDFWGLQTLISLARRTDPKPLTPTPLLLVGGVWTMTFKGRLSAFFSIGRLVRNA